MSCRSSSRAHKPVKLVTVAYTDAAGVHIRTPLLLDYPLNLKSVSSLCAAHGGDEVTARRGHSRDGRR